MGLFVFVYFCLLVKNIKDVRHTYELLNKQAKDEET